MNTRLSGTGVALVTPFDENLNVDWNSLEKLLQHTATRGVDYYVVQGTTGEPATTTKKEKQEILKFVKKNNPYKLPIVYGIGGNNTDSVVKEARDFDFEGVDAVLSISPYYNKPSQGGIEKHFSLLADQCPVPIIIYNVPSRTGSNIKATTTLKLAAHDNIVGIKEASGDFVQCMTIAKNMPSDFMLISGDDMCVLPIMAIGGTGVISVLANAFADIFQTTTQAALSQDFIKARTAAMRLIDINPLMYAEGNPVGVKEILRLQGVCQNYVRLPLMGASPQLKQEIKEVFEAMKN